MLRGILAAFLNKTSYTGTSGTAGAWDYVSVSCNFTGKHNGKIVGFFCGHSHGDSIVTAETPYPVGRAQSGRGQWGNQNRQDGNGTRHRLCDCQPFGEDGKPDPPGRRGGQKLQLSIAFVFLLIFRIFCKIRLDFQTDIC